mgnify:CR=1 FL=1
MAGFFIPDPRFEMPSLLEPGRKPIGPVEIDFNHPLSRGLLTALYYRDGNVTDLVTGRVMQEINSPSSGVYHPHIGSATETNGSSSYYLLTGLALKTISYGLSGMSLAYSFFSNASQSDKRPASFSDGSDFYSIECESSQHQGFLRADGDLVTNSSGGSNTVGSNYCIYQTDLDGEFGTAGRMMLSVNSTRTQSGGSTGSRVFNYDRCSVGALYRGSPAAYFNGLVPMVCLWERGLSLAEVREYERTKGGSLYSMLIPA